ncbi:hypothetical protein E6H21_00700 [Candidatus Bathyarchaeota archaeon]|nr:MAG: hypothetical protein E6H21_00700 [Candidatus Bathyarchaeota archaeon]
MGVRENSELSNSSLIRFLLGRNGTSVLCLKLLFVRRKTGLTLVVVDEKVVKSYCQCGESSDKPFCDGRSTRTVSDHTPSRSRAPKQPASLFCKTHRSWEAKCTNCSDGFSWMT